MGAPASRSGSRAPHEADKSSSPEASIPSAWRAGSFRVGGGYFSSRRVAGWIYGLLAIDRRDTGWAITHIPTGYLVGGVEGPIDGARKLVEVLAAQVDWNFTDPKAAVERTNAVKHAEIDAGVTRVRGRDVGRVQTMPKSTSVGASA